MLNFDLDKDEKQTELGLNGLSVTKLFWVQLKNLSIPKNLRALKTNFEKADGLGISSYLIL